MFVVYLAAAPLPNDPQGVFGSVNDLRSELRPVAQGAALAFAAYIIGSCAVALRVLLESLMVRFGGFSSNFRPWTQTVGPVGRRLHEAREALC